MANRRFSDVSPNKDEKDSAVPLQKPSSQPTPASAEFKQHPHHTGPKVEGPGEVPKAP